MPKVQRKKLSPFEELIRTVNYYNSANERIEQLLIEQEQIRIDLERERERSNRHRGHIFALIRLPELIDDAERLTADLPDIVTEMKLLKMEFVDDDKLVVDHDPQQSTTESLLNEIRSANGSNLR